MTPFPDARSPSRAVEKVKNVAGWSSPVAREAHNLEVTGSNPVPATCRFSRPAQFPRNPLQPQWWQRVLSFSAAPRRRMREPAASHFASQWRRISRYSLGRPPALPRRASARPPASDCEQKDGIWGIYQQHYSLDPRQPRPDDAQWTGAEIKSCCRLAALLDVPLVQAAQNVVPVAVTAGDKIESLRQWASGRCLSADWAGVYSRTEIVRGRGRRVVREPGVN